MDFEEFVERIRRDILKYLSESYAGSEVDVKKVDKDNNTYLGLLITKPGSRITPTIYLEGMYNWMLDECLTVEDVMREIARIREENDVSFNPEMLGDFDFLKDKIYPRLINKRANARTMENLVTVDYMDEIAVTFVAELDDVFGREGAVLKFRKDMLKVYNVSEAELMEIAVENLKKRTPAFIPLVPDIMYILSSQNMIGGSNQLLNPIALKGVSEMLGGDFVIIPSSVNEVLVVPASADIEKLNLLIREVNKDAKKILPEEKLSDNALRYDSSEEKVVLAA